MDEKEISVLGFASGFCAFGDLGEDVLPIDITVVFFGDNKLVGDSPCDLALDGSLGLIAPASRAKQDDQLAFRARSHTTEEPLKSVGCVGKINNSGGWLPSIHDCHAAIHPSECSQAVFDLYPAQTHLVPYCYCG